MVVQILFPLCIAVLIGSLVYLMAFRVLGAKMHVQQRLRKLMKSQDMAELQVEAEKKRKESRQNIKSGKTPFLRITEQLETAGILLKAQEFLLLWGGVTLVPSAIMAIFRAPLMSICTVTFVLFILPPFLVMRARNKRKSHFEKQLADVLVLMSNCMRSGYAFHQAMEVVAEEMPDPIGKEFSRVLREVRLGGSYDAALSNMVNRMKSKDLEMIVTAVLIQRQVGGNLAEILDNISDTIKERIRIKGEIKVMTASGRMSGLIVGLLPIFIMVILMVLNPDYVNSFFETKIGNIMLVVAVIMELMGAMIIRHMVNIKF